MVSTLYKPPQTLFHPKTNPQASLCQSLVPCHAAKYDNDLLFIGKTDALLAYADFCKFTEMSENDSDTKPNES